MCAWDIMSSLVNLEWVEFGENSIWNKKIKEKIQSWKKNMKKYNNCELRVVEPGGHGVVKQVENETHNSSLPSMQVQKSRGKWLFIKEIPIE